MFNKQRKKNQSTADSLFSYGKFLVPLVVLPIYF